MRLGKAPKWNPLSPLTRLGVVSSWILLFVVWGIIAVLPFGASLDSPAVYGVGVLFAVVGLTQLAQWIFPPKLRFLEKENPDSFSDDN